MNRLVLGFILSFTLILTAYAQYNENVNEEGNIGIGPQLGYQRAGDADAGKFMYGAFFRAKLSSAFGVEGSINYRQEEYADGKVTVRSWPVLVSALIYPFPMFYGIAGGGWYNTTFDFDPGFDQQDLADKSTNNFGWHLGAGAEVPIGESVRLIGDVKYVFMDYDWEDFNDVPLKDYNSNFYVISIGLLFGFK